LECLNLLSENGSHSKIEILGCDNQATRRNDYFSEATHWKFFFVMLVAFTPSNRSR
jgi:hypothetical protein